MSVGALLARVQSYRGTSAVYVRMHRVDGGGNGLCRFWCRYKWGLQEGKLTHSCKIEIELQNGTTVLKQQPFETLHEVYTPVPFVPGHHPAE